ncbi:MAG: hypothetical protein LBM73_02320 [Candidatus Nomurabacteria bacterium]|jgi:GH15 family glucan-1,4-alpha-glucosidase|nr:hypothetical protein [Candidatus Nomurabacteria bacterium]
MPARPVILSNGYLAVGLNPQGLVHDFYYPHIGLESHLNERDLWHKVGLWVDGALHWLDNGEWKAEVGYGRPGSLIGHSQIVNDKIQIALIFDDFVDSEIDAFIRNIHVVNLSDRPRDVRLFMHQIFIISNADNGRDTAQFLPDENAILHYKGHRCFVIGGAKARYEGSFDSFSVGVNGIEGKDGVWRDAEDGVLSRNPAEHSRVDSIIEFDIHLDPAASDRVFYWIACGRSTAEALSVHNKVRDDNPLHRLLLTDQFWQKWSAPALSYAQTNLPAEFRANFVRSLLILKAHLDHDGAAIASLDSSILKYWRDNYSYCWPRDAAFMLWAMLRLGYFDEVKTYLDFAARTIRPDGYFMHKFQADGSLGASWHAYIHNGEIGPPIQEDETALTLFLIERLHRADPSFQPADYYDNLIKPAANFMSGYIDKKTKLPRPSYDIWEQVYLTTTFTTATVYAALLAASDLAAELGLTDDAVRWRGAAEDMEGAAHRHLWDDGANYFYKGIRKFPDGHIERVQQFDTSAFYGAYMFGLWPAASPKIKTAYQTLARHYHFDKNYPTIPRYDGDNYLQKDPKSPGNNWTPCALWLAQYNLAEGDEKLAAAVLQDINGAMTRDKVLSEQSSNGQPVGVAPLCWAHAEFIGALIDRYGQPVGTANQPDQSAVSELVAGVSQGGADIGSVLAENLGAIKSEKYESKIDSKINSDPIAAVKSQPLKSGALNSQPAEVK